jgi:hypothetical protein
MNHLESDPTRTTEVVSNLRLRAYQEVAQQIGGAVCITQVASPGDILVVDTASVSDGIRRNNPRDKGDLIGVNIPDETAISPQAASIEIEDGQVGITVDGPPTTPDMSMSRFYRLTNVRYKALQEAEREAKRRSIASQESTPPKIESFLEKLINAYPGSTVESFDGAETLYYETRERFLRRLNRFLPTDPKGNTVPLSMMRGHRLILNTKDAGEVRINFNDQQRSLSVPRTYWKDKYDASGTTGTNLTIGVNFAEMIHDGTDPSAFTLDPDFRPDNGPRAIIGAQHTARLLKKSTTHFDRLEIK